MPRGGKPPISWDKAVEWDRRNRQGETIPEIADKDDYDVRSVRKHVNRVREEQETTEARTELYKEVLREHYQELTDVARQLDRAVISEADVTPIIKSPLASALKEHLPNSPLWPMLDEWKETLQTEPQALASLRESIRVAVSKHASITAAFEGGRMDLEGITNFMMAQADSLLRGKLEFDPENVKPAAMDDGISYQVRYGEFLLGNINKDKQQILKQALEQFIRGMGSLEEYQHLAQIRKTKAGLRASLDEALTTIIYKKLVAGHCRFCPF